MLIDVGYFSEESIIRNLYIPWQWLVAPLFYLFVYHFLQKEHLNRLRYFLLISPFFIVTLIHLTQYIYFSKTYKEFVIPIYYEKGLFLYINILSFLYNTIIIYFIYKILITHEKTHQKKITKIKKETFWLKNILHIGAAISSVGAIFSILAYIFIDIDKSFLTYPFFISLSLWLYWVGYIGVHKSSSYKKLEETHYLKASQKIGEATFSRINNYITEEKKYLTLDISLSSISEKFDISDGYLSKLINEHTGKNFNTYINELRVERSKKILIDETYNQYTIESIGLECGFKSKSNFYSTFKKITGKTPNQYKKQNK